MNQPFYDSEFTARCWCCGTVLRVPIDRCERVLRTAGVNTVDSEKRLCVECDKAIKRRDVSKVVFC